MTLSQPADDIVGPGYLHDGGVVALFKVETELAVRPVDKRKVATTAELPFDKMRDYLALGTALPFLDFVVRDFDVVIAEGIEKGISDFVVVLDERTRDVESDEPDG